MKEADHKGHRPVTVDPKHPQGAVTDRLTFGFRVGEGGMAEIIEVEDRNLRRTMAAKRLRADRPQDDLQVGRLIGEAQVVAQLDHPNIVPVHELAEDTDGQLYYTMKLVRGRDLGEILAAQDHRFRSQDELFELFQVFLKVCDALAFAHSRGVVHRDVKPENIMVGEYGEVYLMDWGLALPLGGEANPDSATKRYTVVSDKKCIVGTPGYMSPEQAQGEHDALDGRADIFSLGAVLYDIITGEPPVKGGTPVYMIFNTLHEEIAHPAEVLEVDPQPELCRIIMKALAKDRDQRYGQVEELKHDLEGFMRRGWQPPVRTYPPRTPIIQEGDTGDEAYIIAEGRCRVFKDVDGARHELRVMRAGDAFGELALFADMPRTASVESDGEARLMVISRDQLEQEIGGGYFLGRFLKGLTGRFVDLDQKRSAHLDEILRRDLALYVLRHVALEGEDRAGRREASWGSLREALTAAFGWSGEALAEQVRQVDGVVLDEARDVVALTRPQRSVWG